MNSTTSNRIRRFLSLGLIPTLLVTAILTFGAAPFASAGGSDNSANPGILPPQSNPYGKSYAEWSVKWWQWFLEHPMAGHPADPDPNSGFDVRSGQSGRVWFLASAWPDPAIEISSATALFIPLVNAECSSLEPAESGFHGDTAAEQTECAKYWADHIVAADCIIDGKPSINIGNNRVVTPQFSFNAPTPWVFGETGGAGTSAADGYYVMVAPLSVGQHTIKITGTMHFAAGELGPDPFDFVTDLTWHITVVPAGKD